jgi:hypothetical protein
MRAGMNFPFDPAMKVADLFQSAISNLIIQKDLLQLAKCHASATGERT